jgi:hypothetical protein
MNSEWNIRTCADQCTACQKKFEDRERLMSRLRFGPDGYLREDCCMACWTAQASAGAGTEVSAWSASWIAPEKKAAEPLKKETAESLLRGMMETDDPAHRNVIFILAVMLERRRVLVEKEVQLQPGGQKIRVYEHKQTGESFIVPDPQLRLKEIESVQLEVMELLGIPPPAGKGPKPAPNSEKSASEASNG